VRVALAAVTVMVAMVTVVSASAATASAEDEALFGSAVGHLREGKAGEAIFDLEALADHGVVDATVSFDRGLAYLARVRAGAEQPGDLGQAAHGLAEARELTSDRALAAEATRALGLVRAEVGRRRVRAGEAVEFDPGMALGPSFLRLLPEDGWAGMAVFGSLALGVALFAWRGAKDRRIRMAGIVSACLGALLVVVGTASAFAARQQRLTVTPGVVVGPGAHAADDRGIVLAGAPVIPEAADVEIVARRTGWTQLRWGKLVVWVPSGAVRAVAQSP
jgi:hypothetical protein